MCGCAKKVGGFVSITGAVFVGCVWFLNDNWLWF
jgi:hypothetical protein